MRPMLRPGGAPASIMAKHIAARPIATASRCPDRPEPVDPPRACPTRDRRADDPPALLPAGRLYGPARGPFATVRPPLCRGGRPAGEDQGVPGRHRGDASAAPPGPPDRRLGAVRGRASRARGGDGERPLRRPARLGPGRRAVPGGGGGGGAVAGLRDVRLCRPGGVRGEDARRRPGPRGLARTGRRERRRPGFSVERRAGGGPRPAGRRCRPPRAARVRWLPRQAWRLVGGRAPGTILRPDRREAAVEAVSGSTRPIGCIGPPGGSRSRTEGPSRRRVKGPRWPASPSRPRRPADSDPRAASPGSGGRPAPSPAGCPVR